MDATEAPASVYTGESGLIFCNHGTASGCYLILVIIALHVSSVFSLNSPVRHYKKVKKMDMLKIRKYSKNKYIHINSSFGIDFPANPQFESYDVIWIPSGCQSGSMMSYGIPSGFLSGSMISYG